MSKLNVAVLFGGKSNEYDLSLKTAASVIRAIPKDKYNIIPIGITKKGRWLFFPGNVSEIENGGWETDSDCTPAVILPDPMYRGILKYNDGGLSIERIDAVFPAVHGKNCEDGVLQGVLDMSGIPYVGSGVLASAVCMDKTLLHAVLEGYYGIKMARWRMLRREKLENIDNFCNETAEFLGFPICVKPARGGSRTGVNTAENIDELKSALKTAFSHDDKAIAEEYIGGRRLEIAVMGNSTADTFTTAVTESTAGNELKPVESSISVMVKDTALKAYKALGCKGFARIGFFYNDNGLYLNRINTIPVFGGESIYPKLMADAGILETELIDRLIKLCLEMHGEI